MYSLQASLLELDLSVRLQLYAVCHLLLFVWARYVVAPTKIGTSRLLRSVPTVPVLVFLTLLFDVQRPDEFLPAMYCTGNFLWLTASKLLAFCLNRGQLVRSYETRSNTAFALSLLFPITVDFNVKQIEKGKELNGKQRHAYRDAEFSLPTFTAREIFNETVLTALRIAVNVALMVVMDMGFHEFVKSGRDFWRDVCLCWFVYGFTAFIEDITALLLLITCRIKLDRTFHYPWMAQSVGEFWSRRYNLVFGRTLRDLAYDPVCEGSWIRGSRYFSKSKPSHLRRAAGVLATFIASALFHIFTMQHVLQTGPFVLYGLFFVVNGIVVIVENMFKMLVKRSEYGSILLRFTPSWIYHLYGAVLMFSLSHWLFWPELNAINGGEMMINGTMKFLGIR